MATDDNQAPSVARFYDRARRQPTYVGEDLSGNRLPFGPYTLYQLGAVVLVGFVGWNTRGIWAGGMPGIVTVITIAGVAVGAGILAGRIDPTARNPLLALLGVFHLLIRPMEGTVGGRAMKIRPAHTIRGAAHLVQPGPEPIGDLLLPPLENDQGDPFADWFTADPEEPELIADDTPQPVTPQPRQSGLEAFLAGARKGN